MASKSFCVTSTRDNKRATARFKEGNLLEYKEEDFISEATGTIVTFIPDPKVFIEMNENFSFDKICKEIKAIAYLNKGIKFSIVNEETKETKQFYSENGIADFISDFAAKSLMEKPIVCKAADDVDEVEVAFMWTDSNSEQAFVFVNGLKCPELGSPATGAKTTITNFFKRYIKGNDDTTLYRRGLVYAVNCKVVNPSFANQTKTKINNPNLRVLTSQAFKEGLENFSNTNEFLEIVEMMKRFHKAELAADKAREAILTHDKEMEKLRSKKGLMFEKLSDAKTLGLDSHLLVAEGRSARSSAEKGRSKQYHGIFEARGKMINPYTASDEKFFSNEEVKLLEYAVGFDHGKPLNEKKLRYGHIDFFVDPDVDGVHIFLLGLCVIWHICPEFVKQGRVGWYHAPLFIVENKGKKTYFYTDEDYNKNGRQLKGEVKRVKGIGLLEKSELHEAVFSSPKAHEVFEYTPDAMIALESLMGADVQPRKDFIFENIDFSEYGEM